MMGMSRTAGEAMVRVRPGPGIRRDIPTFGDPRVRPSGVGGHRYRTRLLPDAPDEDGTTLNVSTAMPFLASDRRHRRAGRQGRFSSLRCGDSTLTPSSAATKRARIEEWT
jgi:hypothetical protein